MFRAKFDHDGLLLLGGLLIFLLHMAIGIQPADDVAARRRHAGKRRCHDPERLDEP